MRDKEVTIRATLVGSYPVPDWLMVCPTEQALTDATAVVLKAQEMAGIDLLTDGELYRFDRNHPETNGMIDYFIGKMEGIRVDLTRQDRINFSQQEALAYRLRPAGVIEGPIGEGTLDLPQDCRRARNLTHFPLKFTVTSPYMLAKVLIDRYYHDLGQVALALAEVLAKQVREIPAEVIQIDEAHITGHPEERELASKAINVVLSAIPCERAVHLCFGNYGGQVIQKGTWAQLIDFINSLQADHIVLEFAHRGYKELEVLKEVRPEIGLGIGVVDIKTTVVESPEEVACRIERAAQILGPDRLKYVHPDCGFWILRRSIADAKMQALVKGRDLFLGIV